MSSNLLTIFGYLLLWRIKRRLNYGNIVCYGTNSIRFGSSSLMLQAGTFLTMAWLAALCLANSGASYLNFLPTPFFGYLTWQLFMLKWLSFKAEECTETRPSEVPETSTASWFGDWLTCTFLGKCFTGSLSRCFGPFYRCLIFIRCIILLSSRFASELCLYFESDIESEL